MRWSGITLRGRGRTTALTVCLALTFLCWPWSAAQAQQANTIPRIGVTLAGASPNAMAEAFRQGLSELGWIEGQNIRVEYRYAEGQPQRYAAMITEFIDSKVNVIVTGGGTVPARIAKQATRTIPIVMPVVGDPVVSGLVTSLARPGGNVTGQSMQDTDISAKRLDLLRQLLPTLKRVAILNDMSSAPPVYARTAEAVVRASGLQPHIFNVSRFEELDGTFDSIRAARAEGLMVLPSSLFNTTYRQRLIDLAAQHRLVAMYEHRRFPDVGGLISYGPNIVEMYRSAARYVDKILKGAQPTDLPIEQPTKFELVINLKTAKALDLTIPPLLLFQATEVIE